MSGELSFACPVHVQFLASYNYPFLSYVWLNLITLPSPGTVTAHAPCHVSYHRGQKWTTFFNHWTQFTYSLSHFYGATTNFKPCYRWKMTFSHCKRYKVNCACAVSRDLCIGGPQKLHITIFWPWIVYFNIQLLCGYMMTIKSSFIFEHPHVKAVFGRKKTKSSPNRCPKWQFFRNLRV